VADPHLDTASQRSRLERVIQDTAGWGALVYRERRGDMCTLRPIVPLLRGYEIVSPEPDRYDIWQCRPQRLIETDLTLLGVTAWLRAGTPPMAFLLAHGARWAEETFQAMGGRKRGDRLWPR
jgi:hypothetical protein